MGAGAVDAGSGVEETIKGVGSTAFRLENRFRINIWQSNKFLR